jgi:RecA-family ATPase
MVHGASGSGKTFVVLDWLLHIATGQPEWKGHKVKQGGVVYLAGEGHNGLKGRMAAWLQHYQVDPVGVPMIPKFSDQIICYRI